MKKFFKSLMSLTLALVLIIPVLLLAGCTKKYTVEVGIAEGDGFVYLYQHEGQSVLGKNVVSEGEKFEFLIKPKNDGWEIESIIEDGVLVTEDYSKEGTYRSFVDIKKNHTVEVKFKKIEFTITLMCVDEDDASAFVVFDTVTVKYDEELDLNQTQYGGMNNKNWWYTNSNNQKIYLYNNQTDIDVEPAQGYASNILVVKKTRTLYSNKTAAQINPAA